MRIDNGELKNYLDSHSPFSGDTIRANAGTRGIATLYRVPGPQFSIHEADVTMLMRLLYFVRILTREPRRYRPLLKAIYRGRCRAFMEIGTECGQCAIQMIQTAKVFHPAGEIEYYGFDLFENLTAEELKKEFSLPAPPYDEVKSRLEKTGAIIHLYRGYTRDTLPLFLGEKKEGTGIDFIFIDGGHSIETIASDWKYVQEIMTPKTVVIFDDYYLNREPEVSGIGCQSLIDDLDGNKYDVEIMEPEDRYENDWGTLRIKMVKVRLIQA